MSTERLHDLLSELVDDVASAGSWETAWQSAVRTRRRRRYAALAGTTAAVLVTVGAVSLLGTGPERSIPAVTPTPSPTVTDLPDAREGSSRIWNSPLPAEEANLPWLDDTALPRRIDLAPEVPAVGQERALAVFAVSGLEEAELRRVVVLTREGSRSLDVGDHVQPVADESGNVRSPLGEVSPDGRYVFFTQRSSVVVYEFATGDWSSIDTPDWLAEGATWLTRGRIGVPRELGGAVYDLYGPRGEARGVMTSGPRRGPYTYSQIKSLHGRNARSDTRPESEAEGIIVGRDVLAMVPRDGRSKGCCPVVDWLDEDTVAFKTGVRVLAWRVGSHDVRRVSEIGGLEPSEAYAVSWATLHS